MSNKEFFESLVSDPSYSYGKPSQDKDKFFVVRLSKKERCRFKFMIEHATTSWGTL